MSSKWLNVNVATLWNNGIPWTWLSSHAYIEALHTYPTVRIHPFSLSNLSYCTFSLFYRTVYACNESSLIKMSKLLLENHMLSLTAKSLGINFIILMYNTVVSSFLFYTNVLINIQYSLWWPYKPSGHPCSTHLLLLFLLLDASLFSLLRLLRSVGILGNRSCTSFISGMYCISTTSFLYKSVKRSPCQLSGCSLQLHVQRCVCVRHLKCASCSSPGRVARGQESAVTSDIPDHHWTYSRARGGIWGC